MVPLLIIFMQTLIILPGSIPGNYEHCSVSVTISVTITWGPFVPAPAYALLCAPLHPLFSRDTTWGVLS